MKSLAVTYGLLTNVTSKSNVNYILRKTGIMEGVSGKRKRERPRQG